MNKLRRFPNIILECLKCIINAIILPEEKQRYWFLDESRVLYYQKIEKEYQKLKTEKDVWYDVANAYMFKYQHLLNFCKENFKGRESEYEK